MRLRAAVDVSQTWIDNVFYSQSDTKSDSVTRIFPRLALLQDDASGHSVFKVGGTAKRHNTFDELDGFDPFASFDTARQFTARLSLFADGKVEKRNKTDAVESTNLTLYGRRPDVLYYRANAGGRYMLSPSTALNSSFGYNQIDYSASSNDRSQYADYKIYSVQASIDRGLSTRDTVGLVATVQRIALGGVDTLDSPRSDRDDDIVRLAGIWNRVWTPRLSTRVEAGARYLTTDGGQVSNLTVGEPGEPQSSFDTTPDDSFAFTGTANLQYQTLKGSLDISLSQETRPDNGRQGSRNVSTAQLSLVRRLLKKLTFSAGANYSLSRSAGDVVQPFPLGLFPPGGCSRPGEEDGDPVCLLDVESDLDERTWQAWSEFSWQFSRRWSTFVRYDHQRYSNDLPFDQDWSANRVRVGVRWAHDLPL
ncbi:MAG: hypothetical protein JRG76_08725 [Deltaproteobacteria bacterium]|nr:hypothetical protein [Deltaproteobacteria bacterium]